VCRPTGIVALPSSGLRAKTFGNMNTLRHLRQRRDFLIGSLGAVGYLSLAACGGGDSGSDPLTPAQTALPQLLSISPSTLADIVSRPENFLASYEALGGSTSTPLAYVQSRIGSQFASLTDTGALTVYATVIACNAAPLGDTPLDPMSSTLSELLTATSLVCGHYCKLTTLLSLLGNPLLIPPDPPTGAPPRPVLHTLVWLDTVPLNTGFHSQLIISGVLDNAYLLLDPTYGYALRVPFVGSGPQADLTTVENAATLLQTPIDQANLALLDPNRTASTPQMVQALLGGALGPQYIYHDSIYGCEGWDDRIAQVIDDLG